MIRCQPVPSNVFLNGYSCLQKGYHYYSLKLACYFVLVDVTFFESSPYFLPSSKLFESTSTSIPLPVPFSSYFLSFSINMASSNLDSLDLQTYQQDPQHVDPLVKPNVPNSMEQLLASPSVPISLSSSISYPSTLSSP